MVLFAFFSYGSLISDYNVPLSMRERDREREREREREMEREREFNLFLHIVIGNSDNLQNLLILKPR